MLKAIGDNDAMPSHQKLTESMIRAGATGDIFQRGKDLYANAAISNTTISGNTITGDCRGTYAPFYTVRATLDEAGIRSATCSCDYAYNGYCKHIVALLLTYLHKPKAFVVRADPRQLLAQLDRDALLGLIEKLLVEQPTLAEWIEVALTTPQKTKNQSSRSAHNKIDDNVYRRRIHQIFRESADQSCGYDEGNLSDDLDTQLDEIRDSAMQFLAAGDSENALAILLLLIEEIQTGVEYIDYPDAFDDYIHTLDIPLTEVILSQEFSDTARKKLFVKLEKYGGLSAASLAAQASWDAEPTPESKEVADERYDDGEYDDDESDDADMAEETDYMSPIPNVDNLTTAKLNVLARQGRTDDFLALSDKHGAHLLHAEKLCELGRTIDAVTYAQKHFTATHEALQLAQQLREQHQIKEAISVAETGLSLHGPKAALGQWLAPIEEAHGRPQQALAAWLAAFEETPSLERYKLIKKLGAKAWGTLQPRVMTALHKHYDLQALVEVLLFEEQWDEVIKAIGTGGSYYEGSAAALAADTLIDHRPEWVISYSVRVAEALIERTASKYYRIAADWLRRAKKAYTKLGKAADWHNYLGQLKTKYKRRPSLQEQLSQL